MMIRCTFVVDVLLLLDDVSSCSVFDFMSAAYLANGMKQEHLCTSYKTVVLVRLLFAWVRDHNARVSYYTSVHICILI